MDLWIVLKWTVIVLAGGTLVVFVIAPPLIAVGLAVLRLTAEPAR